MHIWTIKGYFETIPVEIEECAKVDGATHWQAFRHVLLPMAVPILMVVFLLAFIGTIIEYPVASVLLREENNLTLAVGSQVLPVRAEVPVGRLRRRGRAVGPADHAGVPGRAALDRLRPDRRRRQGLIDCGKHSGRNPDVSDPIDAGAVCLAAALSALSPTTAGARPRRPIRQRNRPRLWHPVRRSREATGATAPSSTRSWSIVLRRRRNLDSQARAVPGAEGPAPLGRTADPRHLPARCQGLEPRARFLGRRPAERPRQARLHPGLGADVLYLNPIHLAYTNHKYDALDFKQISPEFGTREDLDALIGDVHRQGMKLVLDGVFNHMGRNSQAVPGGCRQPGQPVSRLVLFRPAISGRRAHLAGRGQPARAEPGKPGRARLRLRQPGFGRAELSAPRVSTAGGWTLPTISASPFSAG